MPYPTFWFSNSGLNCNDIIRKLCFCCYYKPLPSIDHISTEFEWDIDEGVSYQVENVQTNSMSFSCY
jgi:hypothetical protein